MILLYTRHPIPDTLYDTGDTLEPLPTSNTSERAQG
jgi:hypothetical protein